MIKVLQHFWSFFVFLEMMKCNSCFKSNEMQICLVGFSWSVNWEPQRTIQLPHPPKKPITTKPLGRHYKYFTKTGQNLFLSPDAAVSSTLKMIPFSFDSQSFQTVLERKLSNLSEREGSAYFRDDRKNVESFKQLDQWLVKAKHRGEQQKVCFPTGQMSGPWGEGERESQ